MEQVEEYVKGKWKQLTAFSIKEELKDRLWKEIVYRYSEQHRFYHNLNHIGFVFSLFEDNIQQITLPAVVGFAILYHDIVYDTYRNDNEQQSAAVAEMHLGHLKVNKSVIDQVKMFILATKDHQINEAYPAKNDLSLFLDFGMAVLGEEPEVYKLYSQKIRQEFNKYSDEIYKEGRKQALAKMLDADLFQTALFRDKFDERARKNMRNELGAL